MGFRYTGSAADEPGRGAGGAGFLGSHLCDHLIARGDSVVCLDDLSTGSRENVAHLMGHERFSLVVTNVSEKVELPDVSRSTPCGTWPPRRRHPAYLAVPWTRWPSAVKAPVAPRGRPGARGALPEASTSEIYGDPEVHPQVESYRGNVDPTGPRSVYDEAKRFSESLTMAMHRTYGVDVGIVRIFNTYGPRLSAGDGRVMSNFIVQALRGDAFTVYGDGARPGASATSKTRSGGWSR